MKIENNVNKLKGAVKIVAFSALAILLITGCKSQKKMKEVQAKEPEPKEIVAKEEPKEIPAPKVEEKLTEGNDAKKELAMKLDRMFSSIAKSGNQTGAQATKNEVMNMFNDKNAPVLIVIYDGEKVKDHDKPTTINGYLDYLSITGNNNAKVQDMELNDAGQITLLELRKNYTNN